MDSLYRVRGRDGGGAGVGGKDGGDGQASGCREVEAAA